MKQISRRIKFKIRRTGRQLFPGTKVFAGARQAFRPRADGNADRVDETEFLLIQRYILIGPSVPAQNTEAFALGVMDQERRAPRSHDTGKGLEKYIPA
jgi:hypothetical protein